MRFKEHDQSEWRKGEITQQLPFRSYQIKTEDGATRRRTSKHVRFSHESPIVMDDNSIGSAPKIPSAGDHKQAVPKKTVPDTTTKNLQRQSNCSNYITRSGRTVVKPRRYQD